MSHKPSRDPKAEQASVTDESIVAAHQKPESSKADAKAHYRLIPLLLLFVFSGLVFYAGTYLDSFSGHFHADIFDERQPPGGAVKAVIKIDPIALGKKQFNMACVTCHQPNGKGIPSVYPPLDGSEYVNGTEERVISIVLHGLKGPLTVEGKTFNAAAMPAFGQVPHSGYKWNDQQIAAVLTYVRQEWGNSAGPIDPAMVTAVREREADRKEWTQAELEATFHSTES